MNTFARPTYSAIRFEQAPSLPQVDQDKLIMDYLLEDVHAWLSGSAEHLAGAKESVKTLRAEYGYTPFTLAQLLKVRLVELVELFK